MAPTSLRVDTRCNRVPWTRSTSQQITDTVVQHVRRPTRTSLSILIATNRHSLDSKSNRSICTCNICCSQLCAIRESSTRDQPVNVLTNYARDLRIVLLEFTSTEFLLRSFYGGFQFVPTFGSKITMMFVKHGPNRKNHCVRVAGSPPGSGCDKNSLIASTVTRKSQ